MSIQPASIPTNVKDKLEEVLARKLCCVSPRLYPAITIDDVLLNNKGAQFPFDGAHPIAPRFSATLAGILTNMGAIKHNIGEQGFWDHFADWDFDVLLSSFCANIEIKNGVGHFNFNGSFAQTRVRLFKACQANNHGKATKVQLAYIYACLEENGYGPLQQPDLSPTHYRENFIYELMNAPAGDFKTYGISQIRAIEKQMHQMIAQWEAVSLNQRERSSKKNEKLVHFGNLLRVLFTRPADRQTGIKLTSRYEECISVDLALFPDLEHNPILKGLVQKEPGFVPYYTVQTEAGGSHVFDDFAGPLTDMKPNNDGSERYDDSFKMWGAKEFENMAGSLDLE